MRYRLPIAMLSLSLAACAGLPPGPSELSKAPQIEFGQPLPADGNFILHYPAGTPLPVTATVDGNLFAQSDQAELHVVLKRDVYQHRRLVSFDGKTWRPGHELISTELELQIPQEDGSKAGLMRLKLNLK